MNLGKAFAFVSVISLLVGLSWLFRYVSRFDPLATQNGLTTSFKDPSIEFTNATMISRSGGKQLWKAQAEQVKVFPVPTGSLDNYSRVEFIGLSNGQFYRAGHPEASFCAAHAEYQPDSHRFDIQGAMHLLSAQGDTLESESCIWTEQTDSVRFDKGARAMIQNHLVTAPIVLFSPKKRLVNCPQGAEIKLNETDIQAGALQWDVQNGLITCTNRFTAAAPNSYVSADGAEVRLKSQIGRQYLKQEASNIDRITANKGHLHLRIEDSDTWGKLTK